MDKQSNDPDSKLESGSKVTFRLIPDSYKPGKVELSGNGYYFNNIDFDHLYSAQYLHFSNASETDLEVKGTQLGQCVVSAELDTNHDRTVDHTEGVHITVASLNFTTDHAYAVTHDDDIDGDGIPDYADGYNKSHNTTADDRVAGERFTPIHLHWSNDPPLTPQARIRFVYPQAALNVGSYNTHPAGSFRVWTKNGDDLRTTDDFLNTFKWYTADQLGFDSDGNATIYIEGINVYRPTTGDPIVPLQVKLDLYPSSEGGNDNGSAVFEDTMNITVADIGIAMDGNRSGTIEFGNPADNKYLFWVNDDHDYGHDNEGMYQEDDGDGPPDWTDSTIGTDASTQGQGCTRDLEDFTRLHIKVDDYFASDPSITYYLTFKNTSGTDPAINLFEAVDSTMGYLQDKSIAQAQIAKIALNVDPANTNTTVPIDSSHEFQLDRQYIKTGNQISAFLLEGCSAGSGDLTLIIRKDNDEIGERSVHLTLRPSLAFIDLIGTLGTGVPYNDDFTESDDYLLFVHGVNTSDLEKKQWTATIFKRLWWQGYTGSVGGFTWDCGQQNWANVLDFYNNSDKTAWDSGQDLLDQLNSLNNSRHAGKITLLAHSQGNVVAGSALHLASGEIVKTYIASQAAISADCYQAPLNGASYFDGTQYGPETPDVRANYPLTGQSTRKESTEK